MQLDLNIFSSSELIRVCQLVGIKNKDNILDNKSDKELRQAIIKKVNPEDKDFKEQYLNTLDMFKIKYRKNVSEENIKSKLYKFQRDKLEKAMNKLSKKKKKILTVQIEESLDKTTIDTLRKSGKIGLKTGVGVLAIQGGAIAITGSNLGICMLMTTGLSSISGLIGITFPFAAYTSAAVAGGWIIQAGHFLASPWTAIPLIGITLFYIYRKARNKPYILLSGVNYVIESKKQLGI